MSNYIHFHKKKIRYKDLDMYSVLYHPNYFKLLDDARNEFFESIGYPIETQFKNKVGFTVAAINDVTFKRPLFMAEEVMVSTEVNKISQKSLELSHKIVDAPNNSLVFEATLSLVFVNIEGILLPLTKDSISNMRTQNIPEDIKKKLTSSKQTSSGMDGGGGWKNITSRFFQNFLKPNFIKLYANLFFTKLVMDIKTS